MAVFQVVAPGDAAGARRSAPSGASRGDLALPGGLAGRHISGGRLALIPRNPTRRTAHTLLLQCRELRTAAEADLRIPGTDQLEWLTLTGTIQPLPLPVMAVPSGESLRDWLNSARATASGVVKVAAETIHLIEALGAAGYQPSSPGMDGVWIEGGALTWLPGALGWSRPYKTPRAETLAAASRAAAEFLHELLQAAARVPDIALVWEELWAICHEMLEHGLGCNAARMGAALAQLVARCNGAADTGSLAPDLWLLLDVRSLHRHLGMQTLDLPGLVRYLLGPEPRVQGAAISPTGSPPHWQRFARQMRLRWMETEAPDLTAVGEEAAAQGCRNFLVICGPDSELADDLARLRAERGRLLMLGSPAGARPGTGASAPAGGLLPTGWEPLVLRRPVTPWRRIGWPVRQDVEVPVDGRV